MNQSNQNRYSTGFLIVISVIIGIFFFASLLTTDKNSIIRFYNSDYTSFDIPKTGYYYLEMDHDPHLKTDVYEYGSGTRIDLKFDDEEDVLLQYNIEIYYLEANHTFSENFYFEEITINQDTINYDDPIDTFLIASIYLEEGTYIFYTPNTFTSYWYDMKLVSNDIVFSNYTASIVSGLLLVLTLSLVYVSFKSNNKNKVYSNRYSNQTNKEPNNMNIPKDKKVDTENMENEQQQSKPISSRTMFGFLGLLLIIGGIIGTIVTATPTTTTNIPDVELWKTEIVQYATYYEPHRMLVFVNDTTIENYMALDNIVYFIDDQNTVLYSMSILPLGTSEDVLISSLDTESPYEDYVSIVEINIPSGSYEISVNNDIPPVDEYFILTTSGEIETTTTDYTAYMFIPLIAGGLGLGLFVISLMNKKDSYENEYNSEFTQGRPKRKKRQKKERY